MVFFNTVNITDLFTVHLHYSSTGRWDYVEIEVTDVNILTINNMPVKCFYTIQPGKPQQVFSAVTSTQILLHMKVTSTRYN